MLRETPEIQLDLAVTGMHCDNAYGNTIHIIEQDNFNMDLPLYFQTPVIT